MGVPHHETVFPPGHIRDRHEVQYKRRCLLGENVFLPEILRRFLLAQECAEHGGRERAALGGIEWPAVLHPVPLSFPRSSSFPSR